MSRTASIHYEDQMLWAYDEARRIWMERLVDELRAVAPGSWPDDELDGWRAIAEGGAARARTIDLTAEQRPKFLRAAREVSDRLDPAPIAELGHAIAALVEGTLEEPPPGTAWYFTLQGRETIRMLA
jgi:hypothetical protein